MEKRPPGILTLWTGRAPGRWPISPGPQAPGVRDALAPRLRSRPRGRVREVVTRRRRPHDRGGGVSTRGPPPRTASSPAHDRHRVGSTGTHARHTSRPPANEWTRAPRGMSPPETLPSGLPRPRNQIPRGPPTGRPRGVVVDAGTVVDRVQRRQERVSLRRVEVPARRIGTQGPCGFLQPFPCCQRECVAEKQRDRVDRKRNRHHAVRDVELPVRKRSPRVGERKANQRRSIVTAERIRLHSPIHVAKRCGVAVVVVLRSLVVGYHDLLGGKVAVPVRLQPEIKRSISLYVHRCLPRTSGSPPLLRSNSEV